MNTIYIQNKTGFDNNDQATFMINGQEYHWQGNAPEAVEIADNESSVRIQMKCRRFGSPVCHFDLKDGKFFVIQCSPVVGYHAEGNLKLFVSVYLLVMVLTAFAGLLKILTVLLFVGVSLLVYFLTIGRGKIFIILQETKE